MGGMARGAKGGGTAPPVIAGLQISTSTYGLPIPIVWGQAQISGNLLWYGNFNAAPVSASGGGKGGGGATPSSYNYTAAGVAGLCEGGASGIAGVAQVLNSKNLTTLQALGLSLYKGTYPQTPWGYLASNFPAQAIGYPGVAYVASGSFQLSGSAQMPNILYEVQGLCRYGQAGQTGLTCTFSGALFGTIGAHNFTLNQCVHFSTGGTLPAQLAANTDYYAVPVSATTFNLYPTPYQPAATSGNPAAIAPAGGGGALTVTAFVQGANPADVITDFIENSIYGVNSYGSSSQIPLSGLTGSTFGYSNYCVANGFFISPALTRQTQASEFVKQVCDITNSAPVWSQGVLTIIPYGETVVTGNGITYTPNTTVRYALTDDDFLSDGASDPIVVTRSNPADAFNQVQVGFPDRTNQYNPNVAQAQDQANIDLYGLRPMPILQHDYITDAQVARNVAQVKLQRVLYIRNQYTFKLGWKYALLEPMDLVSLTDSALGFSGLVVRIIQVEEDSDEQLSMIAEDYLPNNSAVQAVAPPQPGGATAMVNTDPGLSNTPLIFDAPGILTASGFELWMASSGGANWGGAQVWVSTDNSTFVLAGTMAGAARYGVTSSSYPAGADPDTSDGLSINLSLSNAALCGGSTADADNHNTLCLINDPGNPELITYSTASLTAPNQYNLYNSSATPVTYIRRGIYGTSNAAHASGVPFVRLDDAVFKYAYNPAWVGKTIFVKLLPFNLYGASQYTLAMVSATSYTIQGSISKPSNVTGFAASQNGNVVVFQWNASPDPIGYIAGFEFRYAPQGSTSWAGAIPITKVTKGTQITTAKVPPGNWTLMACEVDVSGNYSVTSATCNLAVVNSNILISSNNEAPAWLGGDTNMVRNPLTGTIQVESQTLAANMGASGMLASAVTPAYSPYASASYRGLVVDSGFAGNDRVWGSVGGYVGANGSGSVDPQVSLQTSNDDVAWSGYGAWAIGTANARYYQMALTQSTADGDNPIFTSFIPTVDAVQQTLTGSGIAIGSTPTTVYFNTTGISLTAGAQAFHNVPVVTASVVGSTSQTAVVNQVTATSCAVSIFNNSTDIEASGVVNISATGG
jgi:hypothetical protein